MIKLSEINESNYPAAAGLSVSEQQKGYLDSPLGIIARGYVYRCCRAKVYAIENDGHVVGLALIKDLEDEPACYDLQQFLIDERYQGKGLGSDALFLLLSSLEKERRYDCVEVCVNKNNTPALRLFQTAGFSDTGYTDPELPDCLNLRYRFAALHSAD